MIKSNDFIKTLASTGDILNTINGGMSKPAIKVKRLPDAHQIKIKVPGVNSESLKIEVNDNWLTIYHVLEVPSRGTVVPLPRSVFNKSIPYFINVEGISASIEGGVLLVRLPFNERANGYQRKIRITK